MRRTTIPFLKESENGHDTVEIPEEKLGEEINKELQAGKWVTVEKKDGSSEILTSAAPPATAISARRYFHEFSSAWVRRAVCVRARHQRTRAACS